RPGDRARVPVENATVMDVIAGDDVAPVDVEGSRAVAGEQHAPAAASHELVASDPVPPGRVPQPHAVAARLDEPAVLHRAVLGPFEKDSTVVRVEGAGVLRVPLGERHPGRLREREAAEAQAPDQAPASFAALAADEYRDGRG